MKRAIFSFLFAGIVAIGLTGCGSDEPSNMMEGSSDDALAEYDAMIEADNAAMETEVIGDEE